MTQAPLAAPVYSGADAVIAASAAEGIDVCFANAGTTEMALVGALDRQSAIQAIPVLFEGVASGAADGFARIADRPASIMLHLGPGLANAGANLHNARRAQSPVVCWVGDHATWLAPYDPPLSSDVDGIAQGWSKWVRHGYNAHELARDAGDAVRTAATHQQGVATLVLPMDQLELPCEAVHCSGPTSSMRLKGTYVDQAEVERVATYLRAAERPLLLLGGVACDEDALTNATSIAHAVGGSVMLEQFPRAVRRAPHLPSPPRLAYLPFQARAQLANHDLVVALGADPPVCFFGYQGEEPRLTRNDSLVVTTSAKSDARTTLAALADCFPHTAFRPAPRSELPGSTTTHGALNAYKLCGSLARALPEEAIVVCEGITSSLPLYPALRHAAPHHLLTCKGGAIGFGTPAATGAAVAAPDRRVITYVGDGSMIYTIQSLWTQARESLDVTTIVLVNRKYAVLQMELLRSGGGVDKGAGHALTDLGTPNLDFVALAKGFGVPGRDVYDVAAFNAALRESLATPGPMLIAAHIE